MRNISIGVVTMHGAEERAVEGPMERWASWGSRIARWRTRARAAVDMRRAGVRHDKPLAWRRAWGIAVAAWLITRAGYFLLTWAGTLLLVAAHQQAGGHPPVFDRMSAALALSRWTLWDGHFYLAIANGNYPKPTDAAFFPLYPLLIRVVELVTGTAHGLAAGLLVSNIAALLAFWVLALLALHETGDTRAAERTVWILAAYPLAFFLAATYTDSLFLALAGAVLLAARRGSWGYTALWLALAALARPMAIALVLPVVWEYARQRLVPLYAWEEPWEEHGAAAPEGGYPSAAPTPAAVVWHACALGGLVAAYLAGVGIYALYCRVHFGDAFAFIHTQGVFGDGQSVFAHTTLWPWQTVAEVWREWWQLPAGGWQQVRVLADIAPVLLLAAVTFAGMRHRRAAFTLYLLGVLELCLLAPIVGAQFPDPLASAGRYVLAAVPLWLDAGQWAARWPWLERAALTWGFLLQAVLAIFVLTAGWLV